MDPRGPKGPLDEVLSDFLFTSYYLQIPNRIYRFMRIGYPQNRNGELFQT